MDREFKLWRDFEKSGSVEDYLIYKFESKRNNQERLKDEGKEKKSETANKKVLYGDIMNEG